MALRRSVLSYLEDDAARHSGRCAVIDEGGSCTYGQLYLRARKVGSALAELGARHRAVVVYMEKGIDALSVMFGALCAGGFYVPVDPQVPAERLARIVGVLQDPLVVADELTLDAAEKVGESTGLSEILLAEDLLNHLVDEALLACARAGVIDSDPAYVLFTSGSTGTPKGVAVSHRAIIDFIDDFVRLFGFEETDRVANQAPFDFDVSVKDIYGALACGCTLVVVPRALFSQPAALVSYLEEKQVTIMTWAVAALCLITSLHGLEGQTLSSVRRVMFSGEVMPVDHLRTWMDHLPEAVFVNLYGPTEVTCNCLYHIIDRDRAYDEGIPLGVAFPNRQVLLVGEDGSLVIEPGATGEILVRGVSLALGYVGDEERTAAVWDDPENDELYRAQVRGLLADLHGFSNRMTKFGRLFGDQTTARIDLSRPVDFDISALAQSGDDVVAAVLATTWTSAFAAKNAADVLAEEGLQPRRNHVIIMDEMHRALRASPLMVEKLDLLTRLNRQWGVGQIMITHTFKDLMCMETPAQNTKARGFVERSEIKVLGALSRIEVDRYLRGECGLPVSRREEDMLEDWATPVNFGSDASHKGLGRFLIKLGGLPGIPINVEMCPLEKSGFNDTNLKWHA